jgi:hypothetical protein
MCLAPPVALPQAEVAVPFTVDDKFHSHSKVVAISLAARGLWVSAGTWSSDHRKGGVVPDRVLATLGSTPELEAELLTAGMWKRVRRGVRFHDWERWNDTAEQAAQKDAEAERKREQASERQRRKRARDKEEGPEAPEDVTRTSRSPSRDVTRPECIPEKKPQVSGTHVTRDMGVTSRSSRTPARDFDFDFNQREESQVSQSSVSDARPREDDPPPGTPAFRLQVIAEFAGATRTEIDDETADAITADVLGDATDPVIRPLSYVLASVRNERDPCARWLPKRPATPRQASRLPWCGKCDAIDRTRENDQGKLQRCPECSGRAPAWEAS